MTTEELKRLAEELAEEYALQKAIHLWKRLPAYGPGGDYKENPTKGHHSDVATFLAGFTACAERMGGEIERRTKDIVTLTDQTIVLISKLAIYEGALYDIIGEPPNSMGDHAGIARKALEKGKGKA